MIVIGGGVTGMFVAYFARKRGHDVMVIDKVGALGNTSIHNAGLIAPSSFPAPRISTWTLASALLRPVGPIRISPREVVKNSGWFLTAMRSGVMRHEKEVIRLGRMSLGLYENFLREEAFDVDLVRGVLALYRSAEQAREVAGELNGRFFDEKESAEMGFNGFGGGALFEEELSINPLKLSHGLRRLLAEMGVAFRSCEEATLTANGNTVGSVAVDGESIVGDRYVVAAGARCGSALKPLGYDPHVVAARGLSLVFDTEGAKIIPYGTLLEDYGIALAQHNARTARITSFFELNGFNGVFGEDRKRWLISVVKRHLRGFSKLNCVEEGVGYRPCTPDQLPVIGPIPGYDNLYVASGNCRLGVTLAPVTGYIIESLIDGRRPEGLELKCFSPSRFA